MEALSALPGVCGHRPPAMLYGRVLWGLSEEPKVVFLKISSVQPINSLKERKGYFSLKKYISFQSLNGSQNPKLSQAVLK